MSSNKSGRKVGEHLRRLLTGDAPNHPSEADIAKYLQRVRDVYAEFAYYPRENALLESYFHRHRQKSYCLDMTASGTDLPAHQPAIEASNKAATDKDEALYGKQRRLAEELNAVAYNGNWLTSLARTISSYGPEDLQEIPVKSFIATMNNLLSIMTAEEIKSVRANLTLHPIVEDCIDHCHDEKYMPRVPRDRSSQGLIKAAMVQFMREACDQVINGIRGNADHEGIDKKYNRLKREESAAKANLPDEDQLSEMVKDINGTKLKPTIIRMMSDMHGIPVSDIKKDNISICKGSSTHLMEIALETLSIPPERGEDKKKLLVFSMSWDGLKIFAKDAGMQTGLISGPVNARALDNYIAEHILDGKYADDPAGAKAEVKRQIGGLLVNVPENPLGKISNDTEMRELAAIIEKYDIPLVISDEIFATPGQRSLITYPGMKERSYVISGTSKNLNLPNKLSYGYSDNDTMARRVEEGIHTQKRLHPITAEGFAALLGNTSLEYYKGNQEEYARKRELISETMRTVNRDLGLRDDGIKWMHDPDYGCLGVISLPKKLTDECGIETSCQLTEYIYKLGGIMTVPIGDVETDKSQPLGVRINFSYQDRSLVEAIERIGIVVEHMQKKKRYKDIAGKKYRGSHSQEETGSSLDSVIEAIRSQFGQAYEGGKYDI